jgi:hypothetical protein
MIAGVDIRRPACVVFSLLQRRERPVDAGEDELPASWEQYGLVGRDRW